MPIANPAAGLVIGYHYLWKREADLGREEGAKPRPVLVLATQPAEAGRKVWVLPFTTQTPELASDAVAIPPAVLRMLGLGEGPSWVVVTELNVFVWPGPDLARLGSGDDDDFVLGRVPPKLYTQIKDRLLAMQSAGVMGAVSRSG